MGKLRCKAGMFAQGRLERYCRDQQRPVNVKKKQNCTLAFLVAPLVTAGHGTPPYPNRTRLAWEARDLQRDSDTPAQETLPLWGSPCHVSSSLFSVCSFTATVIALILCPGLQGDSHVQWGFWAGDHHLRKCNSAGTFVIFLNTNLLAKQDMETRCEPCGCTSYLSTSVFAYSIVAWKSLLMILKCSLL